MSEPFFPINPQQVVPILKIDDNDEVTSVQTRKTEPQAGGLTVRIVRIVMGSIFKLTTPLSCSTVVASHHSLNWQIKRALANVGDDR
jgi:hypothetical protein